MGIKRTLKTIVEKFTGTHIFREIPFGVSIAHDISRRFPGYRVNVIFDVGSNVGQSALSYLSTFPSSTIYCFEPITVTFEQLIRNVEGKSQVLCYNFALGGAAGKGTMISEGTSTMNCLVDEGGDNDVNAQETESVDISTLDDFCKANNVNKISYLKIDTEGGDLNVLKGSKDILNVNGVDIVEVEAGMNPNNKHHVPFESLKEFLESHGYFIFGIYEQVKEWPKKEPHLRRTNTVFVSEIMIREYSGK
jgi:FkbM family methyltransferase